jgi:hypothetical protein
MIPLFLPLFDVLKRDFTPWRGPVLLMGSLGLVLLMRARVPRSRSLLGALAVGLPLLVMLPDISPYVGRADTFEFQVVAPRLGIAHPSGYPLYILIGKLFSLLPISTVAWRVNLSSTVFTAAASGMLYLTLTEISAEIPSKTESSRRTGFMTNLLCLIVGLTLAFSPTLWRRSIEAEVYALNAFIVTLGLRLAVRWAMEKLPLWHAMPAFALLSGLAIASHLTLGALLLMAAPLLLTALLGLTNRPRPSFRLVSHSLGLFAAGVGLYLYIPIRWPIVNHGETMTPAHFWRFVTNAESGGALRPLAFIQDPARWGIVLRLIHAQVGWAGILLALVGLAYLTSSTLRRRKSAPRWELALGTVLAFCAWVWFNLSFYVAEPDYAAFLIPGHVVLIFWLGVGALYLRRWLCRHLPHPYPSSILLILGLACLPMRQLWQIGPTLDTRATGYADEAWGRYVLSQPLAQNAAILADSEKFPPLYYLQQIEGLRPDLELVTLFNEAQYRAALQERLAGGQTVYLARYLPGMGIYKPRSMGPLVEITPHVQAGKGDKAHPTAEAGDSEPEATFGQSLSLRTHKLVIDPEGRQMHHLTLVWQATHAITSDLEVRLRLVTPGGEVTWQPQGTRPVNGYTTTQNWQAGDVITDYHALPWPAWLTPGIYTLEVGLFPRFQTEGLRVIARGQAPGPSAQSWLAIETIDADPAGPADPTGPAETINQRNQRASAALPQQLNAEFGGAIWLNGADLATEAPAAAKMTLDLVWKRGHRSSPPHPRILKDIQPVVRWTSKPHEAQAENIVLPNVRGLPYPPTTWPQRNRFFQTQAVHLRYDVPTPDEPGRYHIDIGWVNQEGEQVTGHCTWLGKRQPFCPLGETLIHPAQADFHTNFGDKILLTEAKLGTTQLPPGNTLPLTLQWRGLRAMAHDYTVFVQLIGPDGKLYGQVDTWPSQGTRPTSTWSPGERIDDPHTVPLAPEAPPGRYHVIVGWYLLATMERLPMVNAQGQVTGDFYTLGEITVP